MGRPAARAETLRIATLNLWGRFADWPARLEALGRAWRSVEADVLLLQEVVRDTDGDQAREVAERLGYPHTVATDGHQVPGGSEGIAVLSRRPIADCGAVALPDSDPERRLLRVQVPLDGGALTIVCGHTVAVPSEVRDRQVAALLAEPGDRLIIGADLNAAPPEVLPLARGAGLQDALGDDDTPTWPVSEPSFGEAWTAHFGRAPEFPIVPRRLDYLLSRGVVVTAASIDALHAPPHGHASDHAVVWADYAAAGERRR